MKVFVLYDNIGVIFIIILAVDLVTGVDFLLL